MRLIVVIAICFAFVLGTPVLGKVIQVFFTHRHGARGPISKITDISEWTLPEQLTPVGMRQMYLLGDELRRRYILNENLISPNYDPRSIYVRSTKANRTLESASSFLAGFFPAGTGQNFSDKYPLDRALPPINSTFDVESLGLSALPKNFAIVPIHSTQRETDFMLRGYNKETCPEMKSWIVKLTDDDNYKMIMDKFKPKFEEVIKALDIKADITNMKTMQYLTDTMQMSYLDNRQMGTLEAGTELYNQMEIFHNISALYLLYAYPIQSKVCSTVYFNELINKMEGAVNGTSSLKFVEYSAHDDTVNCVMTALGIMNWQCLWNNYLEGKYTEFNKSCPFTSQPASSILFELSEEDDEKKYVRLLYNGEYFQINQKDKLEYSEFKAFVKNITVDNHEELCLGRKEKPQPPQPQQDGITWWQVAILVLQGILIVGLAAMLFSNVLKLKNPPSPLRSRFIEERA